MLYGDAKQKMDERRAKLERAHRYDELLARGEGKIIAARGFKSERITDPALAAEMDANRARVLVGHDVARKVHKALMLPSEERDQVIGGVAKKLRTKGGLFDVYKTDETASEIADPDSYVYTRAGAEVFDTEEADYLPFEWGAEMRTHLASQDPKASLITDIPDPDDPNAIFYQYGGRDFSRRAAEDIRNNPTQIAVIDDVYAYNDALRKHRVASRARKETSDIIRGKINPGRKQEAQIKRFIANMFRLEGIEFEDGEVYRFADHIANEVSILMHASTHSDEYDANLVWALPAKPIEVEFTPDNGEGAGVHKAKLYTGWETVLLDIKD